MRAQIDIPVLRSPLMGQEISLKDKVVVVTGASRGIGAAIAEACSQSGATVVLSSRKQEGLDLIATKIRESGGRALAVACHAGKIDQVEELFAQAINEFGQVDVLINNAATNPYFGPLILTPDKAFEKTIEVNMKGYFYNAYYFVQNFQKRPNDAHGSIVNIASVLGQRAAPMQGIYGMTKAAVISMTKTLAFELGQSRIRVNAIAPGLIETKFASAIVNNPSLLDMAVKRTPLARHGQPSEIAAAAVYLASDASSFVTGETMVIDGGMTCG